MEELLELRYDRIIEPSRKIGLENFHAEEIFERGYSESLAVVYAIHVPKEGQESRGLVLVHAPRARPLI
jgi:hypothetical protein